MLAHVLADSAVDLCVYSMYQEPSTRHVCERMLFIYTPKTCFHSSFIEPTKVPVITFLLPIYIDRKKIFFGRLSRPVARSR